MRGRALPLLLLWVAAASGQLRYHSGDDLRWASPDFDDSSWPVSPDGKVSRSTSSDLMLWVRARVRVPKDISGPIAVLWPADCGLSNGPSELFVNGNRIASIGHFGPAPDAPAVPPDCFHSLPKGLVAPGKTALVAFRLWTLWSATPRALVPVLVGPANEFRERAGRERATMLLSDTGLVGLSIFIMIAGGLLIILGRVFSGKPLIVKFGVFLLFFGCHFSTAQWSTLSWIRLTWYHGGMLLAGIDAAFAIAMIELVWDPFPSRRIYAVRFIELILVLPLIVRLLDYEFHLPLFWLRSYAPIVFIGYAGIACVSLYGLKARGANRLISAGALLFAGASMIRTFRPAPLFQLVLGPFHFGPYFTTAFIIVIGIGAVLTRNLIRDWKRRQRLDAEIQAARQVQSALMAERPPQIQGFGIDAVYVPADEVGGDFYHVLPCGESACLVVIGDVSGKGLKAAMVASIVAGAVKTALQHTSDPAQVLANVNKTLIGEIEAGFATCCCMRLSADGVYTVANAGHITPYVAGRPIPCVAGLPLGITTEANWEESTGQLQSGETLVLFSDGVIEARQATGELYGFEQVERDLARFQSAAELAKKAQQFGQQDDITVLSIRCREGTKAHALA